MFTTNIIFLNAHCTYTKRLLYSLQTRMKLLCQVRSILEICAWKIIMFPLFYNVNHSHQHDTSAYSQSANFHKQTCKLQNVIETQNLPFTYCV